MQLRYTNALRVMGIISLMLLSALIRCGSPRPFVHKLPGIPVRQQDYLQDASAMATAFLQRNPDHIITYDPDRSKHKWQYEQGLMLTALLEVYERTDNPDYLDFVIENFTLYIDSTGQIDTYKPTSFKLDDITPGRPLLALYSRTGVQRYKLAADRLYQQLQEQPRTSEGGFWHKQIYPWQMWLDGLYMAAPFYTAYINRYGSPEQLADVTKQFILAEKHLRDAQTGLYYHGWDEQHQQLWADPETGRSPSFWSRSLGWYLMALVDVLDILPANTPDRPVLIQQLQELSTAVLNFRDPQSRVWYQVTDQGHREGNYLESSASVMFVYAFARGANAGYLDAAFFNAAVESYQGVLDTFVTQDEQGLMVLNQTCSSAGLGGDQGRDGSYAYYLSEPVRSNDCKAVGPFIMAALQLEQGSRLLP